MAAPMIVPTTSAVARTGPIERRRAPGDAVTGKNGTSVLCGKGRSRIVRSTDRRLAQRLREPSQSRSGEWRGGGEDASGGSLVSVQWRVKITAPRVTRHPGLHGDC